MEDQWGIGGFRGGEKPNIKQVVNKKKGKKFHKSEKSEKSYFF